MKILLKILDFILLSVFGSATVICIHYLLRLDPLAMFNPDLIYGMIVWLVTVALLMLRFFVTDAVYNKRSGFSVRDIAILTVVMHKIFNTLRQTKRVTIELLYDDAMPTIATKGSNGYDCIFNIEHFKASLGDKRAEYNRGYEINEDTLTIFPGGKVLIPLGFKMAMPNGLKALISNKSGIGLRTDLIIPNAPGLIDSDYRGEACVILTNVGDTTVVIVSGKAICQMTFGIDPVVIFEKGEVKSDTDRGDKGHGHSGSAVDNNTDLKNKDCETLAKLREAALLNMAKAGKQVLDGGGASHMVDVKNDSEQKAIINELTKEEKIAVEQETIDIASSFKGAIYVSSTSTIGEDPHADIKPVTEEAVAEMAADKAPAICEDCSRVYATIKVCIKDRPDLMCHSKKTLMASTNRNAGLSKK